MSKDNSSEIALDNLNLASDIAVETTNFATLSLPATPFDLSAFQSQQVSSYQSTSNLRAGVVQTEDADTPSRNTTRQGKKWQTLLFARGEPTTHLDVPLSTWRRALVTFALVVAGFMVGLDQSIIGPALPTIAARFNSLHDIGSYASAYLLPQCILHVICNDVYSIFTFAHVYLVSVLIFGAGCLVSATAASSAALIGGRCLAGVGAVGLATGGFRLLTLLPESKQQNLSMGAFSLILGSSIVVGPILGGVIVDSLNWHWIFYINLPVMGLVLICVILAMMAGGPDLRGEHYAKTWAEKRQHLDWLGTGLLALVMTCFILGLQLSQSDGWNSARVITLFVVSGAAVPALVAQQVRTKKRKIFDPEVVAHRGVWTTLGLFGTALADLVTVILFLPFILQLVKGVSAKTSGYWTFPIAGALTLGTVVSSIISTMTPYFNPFAILGCCGLVIGTSLFLTLGTDFSMGAFIGYEVVCGFSLGLAWLSEIIYPRAVLDKHQLGESLSYSRMLQQLGATVSVQVATVIFTSKLEHSLATIGIDSDNISPLLAGSGQAVPEALRQHLKHLYSAAINKGLVLAVAWSGAALFFALALPWPKLKGGITDRAGAETEVAADDSDEVQVEVVDGADKTTLLTSAFPVEALPGHHTVEQDSDSTKEEGAIRDKVENDRSDGADMVQLTSTVVDVEAMPATHIEQPQTETTQQKSEGEEIVT